MASSKVLDLLFQAGEAAATSAVLFAVLVSVVTGLRLY